MAANGVGGHLKRTVALTTRLALPRLSALNDLRPLLSTYLLYNSTMSCSCPGRLICSRVGSEPIFADISAESHCSHSGTPRPLTSSSACRIAGTFRLLCLTATTSPGLTEYDGMSTLRPFTVRW